MIIGSASCIIPFVLLLAMKDPATVPSDPLSRARQQVLDWHYRGDAPPPLQSLTMLLELVRSERADDETVFCLVVAVDGELFQKEVTESELDHWIHCLTLADHAGGKAIAGKYYINGEHGFKKDEQLGYQLLQTAYDRGDADAALVLGDLFRVSGDVDRSIDYYIASTALGKVKAWSSLAYAYLAQNDRDRSAAAFLEGAKAGDAISLYTVGRWHRDGKVARRNLHRARELFEEASRRGLRIPEREWQRLLEAEAKDSPTSAASRATSDHR